MASTTAVGANGAAAQVNGAAASNGSQIASLPADAISYEDLYRRWEHGNWSAMDLDFGEDAKQWQERFSEFERQAALWNYALFFWGEDAVADNLSPYIDAAPLEEQKYFLTTQQVDEARHAVFFKRFMHEVCGIGDGSPAGGLAAIKPQLSPGFVKIFERLDSMAAELRKDRSRPKLAAAVTLYHVIIEATMAQPGQHMICSYLEQRDVLPAFRAGMENISADEQRHIGFGVKLISDLAREDPRVPTAVAGLLREVMPFLSQVMMPPGWDERYLTCFGYDFETISVEAATSMRTKLRSAGLPLEELPGPPVMPPGLSIEEASRRGRELARAGVIGVRQGPTRRDPQTVEPAVRHDQTAGQPAARPAQADHAAMGVHRRRRAHLAPDRGQRLKPRRAGRRARPRRADEGRLPRLRQHHRQPPEPGEGDRHRQAAPARQSARARQDRPDLPAGLKAGRATCSSAGSLG